MESMSERQVITVEEAAKFLGISRGTAYAAAREGTLPGCRRIGQRRFIVSRKALELYLVTV